MDTLTHALSGALIARATASGKPGSGALPLPRRIFVGFVSASFPDIDVVASYLSPLSYLYHHRGVTHSILLLPLWAALLAVVFALLWRRKYTPDPITNRDRDPGAGWRAYYGIAALGIGTHIAGDWITSFGTMLFAPFSDARYALSATFIIDLWFTGIILAGLLAAVIWRSKRAPAVAGFIVLIAYVGSQWLLQREAIDFGKRYAAAQELPQATVTAVPRPVSPFNWTVFVVDGDRYTYAHVNLVRKIARPEPAADTSFVQRLDAPYRPLHDARWMKAGRYGTSADESALAREAYSRTEFEFFRWFAAYPALLGTDGDPASRCVWFHDLRFVTPGREGTPFRYGMCREETVWKPFQLIGEVRVPVY